MTIKTDRRTFIQAASAVAAAGVVGNAWANGPDEIRVGLIGCGGRGTQACENVLDSSPGVKIMAVADVFKDRAKGAQGHLRNWIERDGPAKQHGNTVAISDDHVLDGLDAYRKLLTSDINYVILATPPGFRPLHLEAAVAAGKHVFTEKPVCVDGPGARRVLALDAEVKRKGLGVGAGTQRRHQSGYIETIKRVHEGAIGDIVALRCYWNSQGIWFHPRKPGMSDAEYQIYNWYHFLWICGDQICEQHIHNLDVCNWAMKAHPVRCDGAGSRIGGNPGRPNGPPDEVGNIFDNFSIDYEYPGGVHMYSSCRHIPNCASNVSEALVGNKGTCQADAYTINGKSVAPRRGGANPYVQEHADLIESIRTGSPINELKAVAESSLTAVMGRMSAYTGRPVTWDQALNSQDDTFPANLTMEMSLPVTPIPVPGKTKLR